MCRRGKSLLARIVAGMAAVASSSSPYNADGWYDCLEQVGGEESAKSPHLTFVNASAYPKIAGPSMGQVISMSFVSGFYDSDQVGTGMNISVSEHGALEADYHHYRKVLGVWIPYATTHDMGVCEHYPQICASFSHWPARADTINVTQLPYGLFAPYGSYRLRHVYRSGTHGMVIGCIDLELEYRGNVSWQNVGSGSSDLIV